MTDTVGLHFVVSTPVHTLDKRDRKAIRSHATKASVPRRQAVQLQSWISPDRGLGSLILTKAMPEEALTMQSVLSMLSPKRFGSDFSGLQLPSGVEPYMIQDLVQRWNLTKTCPVIDLHKHGVYPYEICLDVHPAQRGWFPYMISDVCCLHSLMFSVRTFVDGISNKEPSRLARYHYGQTLQLLQARLYEFDQTSAISDATIMVVITLAGAAELIGDLEAATSHIKGLEKIVNLRGGVRALNTHNNLQVKVCRADLGFALLLGHRPYLFREGISWDCFIADRGLIQCNHQPHDTIVRAFAEVNLDIRLLNALRDLHAFSCISNLAYQTTRKISPTTYNEMMISILYRLTHLCFKNDVLQEVIRAGLLAFCSTIFMQRHFMDQPYENLLNLYSDALFGLRKSTITDLPTPIVLWLTMLSHVVTGNEHPPADWRSVWLDNVIFRSGIDSWPQAHEMLRSIAWVDFVHNRIGKLAFESSVKRLKKSSAIKRLNPIARHGEVPPWQFVVSTLGHS